jgi:hypothetical protein
VGAFGKADGLQQGHRLGVSLGRPVAPAVVKERQLDILERGRPGEQAEVLEDEADLLVAQLRPAVAVEARDVLAVEEVVAGGRVVEQTEDVHEGGLAGARRAHHRDEGAGGDVDADAAQGVHDDVPERIEALEVDDADEGLGHGPSAGAAVAAAG